MKKVTKQAQTVRSLKTEELATIVGGANTIQSLKGPSPGDVAALVGAAAAEAGSLGSLL